MFSVKSPRPLFISPIPRPEVTKTAALKGVETIENELNELFLKRSTVIRSMIMAVLSGEHAVLLSDTGAAKTAITQALLKRLEGRTFQHQCAIRDTDIKFFGPIDATAYKDKGEYKRNTKNGIFLQEADWAFIDEIFDCPDQILRILLQILNEGTFKEEDGAIHQTRLKTAFSAANYLRINEVTRAVVDRFMFAPLIDENLSPIDMLQIGLMRERGLYDAPPERVLSLEEVKGIVEQARQIHIPTGILYLKNLAISRYNEGVDRKDRMLARRAGKTDKTLKIQALLNGRNQVIEMDLNVLQLCMGPAVADKNNRSKMEAAIRGCLATYAGNSPQALQLQVLGAEIDGLLVADNSEMAGIAEGIGVSATIPRTIQKGTENAVPWMVDRMNPCDVVIKNLRDYVLSKRISP